MKLYNTFIFLVILANFLLLVSGTRKSFLKIKKLGVNLFGEGETKDESGEIRNSTLVDNSIASNRKESNKEGSSASAENENVKEQAKLNSIVNEVDEKEIIEIGKDVPIDNTYLAISLTQQGGLRMLSKKSPELKDTENNDQNVIAESYYYKTLLTKGWHKLSISTYNKASAETQAFLAGYLEGRQTFEDIYNFYYNLKANNKSGAFGPLFEELRTFFRDINGYLSKRVEDNSPYDNLTEEHWRQVKVGYKQLRGLLVGYNQQAELVSKPKMEIEDLLIVQADGEVPELLRYLNYLDLIKQKKRVKLGDKNYFRTAFHIDTEDPSYFWKHLLYTSKCSAFIKLLKDKNGEIKDIISGHATWSDYSEMLRTYKHYNFELDSKLGRSEITFSSYPGCLSSTDDFYLTNHRLMVTETTIDVVDISLFEGVKPKDKYIPNFLRVMAASRIAKTGEDWVQSMRDSNSGTYSSQWMIVDYNLFEKAKKEKKEVEKIFLVFEQVPGTFVDHDVTSHLFKYGYFGSFNRAFFSETKDSLHDSLIKELYGNFAYNNSKRKIQFQYLEGLVKDLEGAKDVLRYNGYKNPSSNFNDPSVDSPANAIAARADLEVGDSNLSGALDAKITNLEMVKSMTNLAISGPTTRNNKNLPIFDWTSVKDKNNSHIGVPDKFDFHWLVLNPMNLRFDNDSDREESIQQK